MNANASMNGAAADGAPSAADAPSDATGSTDASPKVPPADAEASPSRTALVLSQRSARDLKALLAKYFRRHRPPPVTTRAAPPEPPRETGTYAKLLPLLRLIPGALLALFVLSFVWDFDTLTTTILGHTLVFDGLLRVLSVSGLIGFLTNWLAITMLFQPRQKRPLVGQGLIPSQRERVIYRLARAVADELINEEIIKRKIQESGLIPRYRALALSMSRSILEDPEFRRELKALVARYAEQVLSSDEVRERLAAFTLDKVESYAGSGLSGLALKAYRFFNEDEFQRRLDQAIRDLPASLDTALDEMDEVLDRLPAQLEARSDEIEQWVTNLVLRFVEQLDVYTIVMENMQAYDEQQLEDLLKRTTNEQLNYIKYLGGVLGVLGGFVIWEPLVALGVFGVLGGLLWAVDEALFRARRAEAASG